MSFRTQHDQVGKLRLRSIPHFSGIRHIYVGGSKEDGRRLRQKQGHGDALTGLSLEDNRKNEVVMRFFAQTSIETHRCSPSRFE